MIEDLVGREAELAKGSAFLDSLSTPRIAVCLIEGEAGIGKSALLTTLAASAADRGVRVLRARPAETEAAISFAGLGDLLDAVEADELNGLSAHRRDALEVALQRREPTQPAAGFLGIGGALASLLGDLASRQPILIAIDDVQWLDLETTRVLTFALRRIHGASIGVLLAMRSTPDGVLPLGFERQGATRITYLRPGPLVAANLRRVVEDRFGARLTQSASQRLHMVSGGNPYFAFELFRSVSASTDEGRFWGDLAADSDFSRLTKWHIETVPPSTRSLLAAVAALGDPPVETLTRLFDSTRGFNRAIDPAIAASIVRLTDGRIRFDHPLLAAAAYAGLTVRARAALHRRLARIAVDPEERARHLALGTVEPDASIATVIAAGAKRAAERGAQEAAADLSLSALRLTPEPSSSTHRARTLETGAYLAMAGDSARAREMYQGLLATIEDGPERAVLLRQMAELHLQEGGFAAAIELLREAADQAGEDPSIRFQIDLQLTYALTNDLAPIDAHRFAVRALLDAERMGAPPLIAIASAVEQMAGLVTGRGLEEAAAERAITAESAGPALLRPRLVIGILYGWTGHHLRARELVGGVEADATALGDEPSLPPILMYLSWLAILVGDLEAATRDADRAMSIAVQIGGDGLLAQALVARARVSALRGGFESARADASRAIELFERSGWRSGHLWAAGILGSLEWWAGDGGRALAVLRPLLATIDAAGYVDPAVTPFLPDLIEALLGSGLTDEADELIDRTIERGERVGSSWAGAIGWRCRALRLASDGQLDAALSAAEIATTHLGAVDPMPFESARTFLVRGRIERRGKRRGAARTSLGRALTLFQGLGAEPWVALTHDEIARLGRGRTTATLTETESLVASLAAQGLTNREVGDRAFLTPKSVEGILSRAYVKLGIRSRAELGAWAARGGTVTADEDQPS